LLFLLFCTPCPTTSGSRPSVYDLPPELTSASVLRLRFVASSSAKLERRIDRIVARAAPSGERVKAALR